MIVDSKNYRSVGYGLGVHPNRPQAVPNRSSDNLSSPIRYLCVFSSYRFGWASVQGVQLLPSRSLYDILEVLLRGGLDHPPSIFSLLRVETHNERNISFKSEIQ
jgi:hypothetical protein